MGLKAGLNFIKPIVQKLGVNSQRVVSSAGRTVGSAIKTRSMAAVDTFTRASQQPNFDDVYQIVKINRGKIRILPKFSIFQGKILKPFEMPEYLYHITSEENMKLISTTGVLQRSCGEQLPGVYLLDKENFLSNYASVGRRKYNLVKSLLNHAKGENKDAKNLFVIKIPTASLIRNGNMRIRTQEDFFYFQDKILELQKGLKKKYTLRMLRDDTNRANLRKYILDNHLMTESQTEQFFKEMSEKIHYGFGVDKFEQLEKNSAVEFIFSKDITPEIVSGITNRKFSIEECIDQVTKEISIEKLRRIFG